MSSQPEAIFYVDENLDGEAFVGILRTAGVALVRCRDLNLRGTDDAIWIPRVSAASYIILTADVRTRYRPAEKQALVASGARAIHLKQGGRVTHPELAQNFVSSLPDIYGLVLRHPAPWIATLSRPLSTEGNVAVQGGKLNLLKLP